MNEEYLQSCAKKAAESCVMGNYQHNRNPHFAALWSSDSDIRVGAIILCEHLLSEGLLTKERVLTELWRRQDVETIGNIGQLLHVMIKVISSRDSLK